MPAEPITERENYLRMLEYRYPQWIPCVVGFAPRFWNYYRQDLENIVLAHPRLFPDYRVEDRNFYDEMPPVYREGETYLDNWGCLWQNIQNGLEGVVVGHPLADWSALETYRIPDPLVDYERGEEKKNWDKIAAEMHGRQANGKLAFASGERLFDRLYFLRGFENLMMDFIDEPPQLSRLIDLLEEYELRLIEKWIEIGVDVIGFHTDFGTQKDLMISPASFRKYIKPFFSRLFQTCRRAGIHVYLSSDGNLLRVVDDLIECGVSVHDPQLRANTLQGIVRAYKGKLPAFVDLDRQSFPFITPRQIREQVKEVVGEMALPEGGLGLIASFYGGVDIPLRNIEAMCEALEKFCFPKT